VPADSWDYADAADGEDVAALKTLMEGRIPKEKIMRFPVSFEDYTHQSDAYCKQWEEGVRAALEKELQEVIAHKVSCMYVCML
jgi:hypothetical protein